MTHDLSVALLNVILGLSALGVFHLITTGVDDTPTRYALGWVFASGWSLAVILEAIPDVGNLVSLSLFLGVVFIPAIPFGLMVEHLKRRRQIA